VIATLAAFGAVAAGMLRVMPEPLTDSDYLVVGSVATLVALLVLFLGLTKKSSEVFFKKRAKK
ncbi:MAG: hypothetical protein ABI995_06865, partial [Acidobacteriota bacterium]